MLIRFPCSTNTPLGLPDVPDVYMQYAKSDALIDVSFTISQPSL